MNLSNLTFRTSRLNKLCSFIISLLIIAMIVPAVSAKNNSDERQKIVQQVAAKWMQIGEDKYDNGYYQAAEEALLRAKVYEEYLSSSERKKLQKLLEKTHSASAKQRAKDQEQAEQTLSPMQMRIAQIYNNSVDAYNAGDLEKAREGFLEVAKSNLMIAPAGSRAEDYLAMIDAQLMEDAVKVDENSAMVEKELFGAADEVATEAGIGMVETELQIVTDTTIKPEPVIETGKNGGYIDVIKRRQALLRSYTKSVVSDAIAKAEAFKSENKFAEALKSIDYAQSIVNRNQFQLGQQLAEQYNMELKDVRSSINTAKQAYQDKIDENARIQAQIDAEKARIGAENERKERIKELMDNAILHQSQQRYEEALGQLHSVLAIDPLHQEALILKDTLEDTVAFREQLEVIKEREKERAELLMNVSESGIPWANEITYPKNWHEISERRDSEDVIGQDPATARIYEQLEQIVDLSDWNRDMSLSDAIEILRNVSEPPIQIFVNWRDLEDNADIDQETPINMDPLPSIKLSLALRLLLDAVSGGFVDLDYSVENGIITIATIEQISTELVTLVYDVTDLVQRPANYQSSTSSRGGGSGSNVEESGAQFDDDDDDDDDDSERRDERGAQRTNSLIQLIQNTVEPDSWSIVGGPGEITSYSRRLLSIRQTPEIHTEVSKLLKELRKAHGYQIAIEARFLTVQENFLEEIGLDLDFVFSPGGKFTDISFTNSSALLAESISTGIQGTLGGSLVSSISGGYGTILDNLQVSFLLNASQAHTDTTLLTAPKATVLSGESATFRSQRYLLYAGDIDVESREPSERTSSVQINYDTRRIRSGTILNITPTLSSDKKHVLLNINVQLSDFLGFRKQVIDVPLFGDLGGGDEFTLEFPETEVSQVRTRVSVPDGGTLLLGGQKLSAETEREASVPVLSRIPVVGRLFANRSKVKDNKVLLILVRPTVIIHGEAEADAMAALENEF